MFFSQRRPQGRSKSMAALKEHSQRVFQNLSMPWAQEEGILSLSSSNAANPSIGQSGIVHCQTAAEESMQRSSTSSSWLSRKPSFKAAAKSIRSVSVTTMAAAVTNRSRSPSHHHRVASTKSAKASLGVRKTSESSMNKLQRKETSVSPKEGSHPATGMQHSSTTSSLCTSASQDISLPALESEAESNVVFDLTMTSKDSFSEESNSRYGDSLLSYDDSSLPPGSSVDLEEDMPIKILTSKAEGSPTSIEIEENEAYTDESEWAKKALKMRRGKGRIDSTTTNEVTFINTILNKNLTVTDEGNEIRRRIELQSDDSPKDLRNEPSKDAPGAPDKLVVDPPVLTIEPPSPMPTSVSPYYKKYSESDSETNTGTNPIQSVEGTTIDNPAAAFMPTADSRRHYRGGHKTSQSFHSVRDSRPRRSRSSDRGSSEPPQFDLENVRERGGVVNNPIITNDSDSDNDLLTPSSRNQSYRRLLEASSGSAATTANKTGSCAIPGGHSNSRHPSGDSSPKG